jgi:HK97 family phage portal protein
VLPVRVVSTLARPFEVVGEAVTLGASMIFNRTRGGTIFLARTRIDYASEIGDPATNSIVGAVVGWIARNLPEAPIRLVREDTTEIAYPPAATGPGAMLRLLKNPNPYYSGNLLWRASLVDYYCRGDAYWIKGRAPGSRRVTSLWWVPANMMSAKWPEDRDDIFIGWYEYRVDGIRYAVPPGDVVHFRHGINPRNVRQGISPLASLTREIFTDEEASNFTASLLRNLGVPGVVIAPANTTGPGGRQDPETVKTKFMEKFGGDKRGEPLVLTSPTDVKVLSFNPQEMELRQLRRIPEERISAVLGVPAGVAQLGAGLDRNTFTNYGEGNVAAYTQGVIPTQGDLAAVLELQLLPEFTGGEALAEIDVWFDWTKVAAMQAAADAVWRRFEGAATKGLVMRSQFKRAVGLDVEQGDDVYVVPNNYTFVEADKAPPPLRVVPDNGRIPVAPAALLADPQMAALAAAMGPDA